MDFVKRSRVEQLDSLDQALMDSLTTSGILNKTMIATIDSMMIADSLEVIRLEKLRQLKLQVAQQAQRKKSLVVLPKESEIQRNLPPTVSTHWDVPLEALTLKQDGSEVPTPQANAAAAPAAALLQPRVLTWPLPLPPWLPLLPLHQQRAIRRNR